MKQAVKERLDELHQAKPLLNVRMVLEDARDEDSPLHDEFEWDNEKAAEQWRVHHGRKLLATYVTILEYEGESYKTRAMISLSDDRQSGGGYRSLREVMNHKELREMLLQDALDELEQVRVRYEHLQQLSSVWDAIKTARKAKRAPKRNNKTERPQPSV